MVVGVEQEHAGQRREPGLGDVGARIGRGFGVEYRVVAGPDGEAERAGRARAVQQRMHHDGVGARCRALQPERLEHREFLAGRVGRLDRQAAGREPVALALGDRAEIAGAEEGADLVAVVGTVQRVVDAEPGEADVAGGGSTLSKVNSSGL